VAQFARQHIRIGALAQRQRSQFQARWPAFRDLMQGQHLVLAQHPATHLQQQRTRGGGRHRQFRRARFAHLLRQLQSGQAQRQGRARSEEKEHVGGTGLDHLVQCVTGRTVGQPFAVVEEKRDRRAGSG
jgi:hypothetical protein